MEISYIIDIKKQTPNDVNNDVPYDIKLSNNQLVWVLLYIWQKAVT